jgi:hypothetical protein
MDTELKRGATMDVSLPRDERRAPLMASWRYGSGKSVALMMDMESKFSRNWIQWGGLRGFFEAVLQWLRPAVEPMTAHEARVSLVNLRPVLDLFLFEEASSASQFSFEISGKGGTHSGHLKRIAAGHFQSPLPISAPGEYKIELTETRRDRRIPLSSVSYVLPYSANTELPRPFVNTDLLSQLARTSGGEINPPAQDIAAAPSVTSRAATRREPLIALAFLIFLLEVALRKFVLAEAD